MEEYKGLKFPKNIHKYTLDSSKLGCAIVESSATPNIGCQDIRCRECIAYENKHNIAILKEYLNEGGKDVKEFEVGGRVDEYKGYMVPKYENLNELKGVDGKGDANGFCNAPGRMCPTGGCPSCLVKHGDLLKQYIKERATKPKTTKENNMELNSSIRTVLVDENKAEFAFVEKFQKTFGKEIAENFTGAMILRANITMYVAEIKRLDDIEAKRLKEAAKK